MPERSTARRRPTAARRPTEARAATTAGRPATALAPTSPPWIGSRRCSEAWKWSGSIENGTEQPISECEARTGYFIGPDFANVGPGNYAQCAVARGEIIPLRGGVYPSTATGCTDLACSDMGILMKSAESAAVYALGPDGKTTGSPAFYFSPIPSIDKAQLNLAQSNVPGSLSNAKRLIRHANVPSCTK